MKAVRRSRTSLFNDVLRNFLFKEIFKGCCLLFSYQGSCRSFLATALIFYQIRFALSRTFLFSFVFCCPSRVSLNIIALIFTICQPFFTSFSTFLTEYLSVLYMVFLHDIITLFPSILRYQILSGLQHIHGIKKLLNNSSSFLRIISSGEGGI